VLLIFLIIGSAALFLAIFANRLSLDYSPGWGSGRLALLLIGLVMYGILVLSYFSKNTLIIRDANKKIIIRIRILFERIQQIFVSSKTGILFGIFVSMGITIYALWYSSAGRFPLFPSVDNAYIDLGESFLQGKLSLLEEPDPRLMELDNPYDFKQRENVPYRWDASYYQGKYYLYWGPVPALVSAAFDGVSRARPSASLIILIPYIGLAVIILIILLQCARHFFPVASSLSPGLFTVLGVINLPFIFLLGAPQIYHTSIIYGQFFLFLGVLGWVIYICKEKPAGLVMAGLSWGLAIGSRYNLGISVAVYLVFALIWMGRETRWKPSWKREGFLLIPLTLCLLGLGAYNFFRFGNPLDVGQTYQLTVSQPRDQYFSILYLLPNLYAYLFYPLTFVQKFPFVKSALFDPSLLPNWLNVPPQMLFDHNVFGIFPSAPGFWLIMIAIPLFILARMPLGRRQTALPLYSKRNNLFAMITLAGGVQFLFLTIYFHGAERFVPDFYIPITLGIAALVWKLDEIIQRTPGFRFAFWLIVAGLTIWTAGIGFFGGFGVPPKLFRSFNLELYTYLASYWNDHYAAFNTLLTALGFLGQP
jgi:hypothetical protein